MHESSDEYQVGDCMLTPEQAAQRLKLRPHTLAVWRTTRRQRLPFVKVGSRVRYRAVDIDRYISSQTVTP